MMKSYRPLLFGFSMFFLAFFSSQVAAQQPDAVVYPYEYNTTSVWTYAFLRNTTKEFLQNAKSLELSLWSLLEKEDALAEKDLLLRQGLTMAELNVQTAQISVNYANQSQAIAEQNLELANLRITNKAEQIRQSEATLRYIKRKNSQTRRRNLIAKTLTSAITLPFNPVEGIQGVVSAGLESSNQITSNAIQTRQAKDQIDQLRREKTELEKMSVIASAEIAREKTSVEQAYNNLFIAQQDVVNQRERIDLYLNENITLEQLRTLQKETKVIWDHYVQFAIVLARLTVRAYELEEVKRSDAIKSYEEYTAGASGQFLASDRILLDLNTIEFARITQKTQKSSNATHIVSLANKSPAQFQQLIQRGIMTFDLSQFELDLNHPGTYARTINSVDVQVIALTDPAGVKGLLTKESLSWQKVPSSIIQSPDDVTYSDWLNYIPSDYRLLLYKDPEETLILPKQQTGYAGIPTEGLKGIFEGRGLAGSYTLELPTYSNSFDYNTIVDVIVTFNFSAYFDPVLKAMVETEFCEMNRLDAFNNQRVLSISLASYQPEDMYQFNNPISTDTLSDSIRLIPILVNRAYLPTNQTNPKVNELEVSFIQDGEYLPIQCQVTSKAINDDGALDWKNGQLKRSVPIDSLYWTETLKYITNPDETIPDTIFIQRADSLFLYKDSLNYVMPDPSTSTDTLPDYELWVIRINAKDNPTLQLKDDSSVFDLSKLAEIDDIIFDLGYSFSYQFCQTNVREIAWMEVDRDTTMEAINSEQVKVPYLYANEFGRKVKKIQTPYSWYEWETRDTSFYLQEFIRIEQSSDLIPFSSFLKVRSPIEEIEVQFDLNTNVRTDNRFQDRNKLIVYFSPSWVRAIVRKKGNGSKELIIEKEKNLDECCGNYEELARQEYGGDEPIHLKFRYLNLPNYSGKATLDLWIVTGKEKDRIETKAFRDKPIVFTRWRERNQTNFAMKIDIEDAPVPNFVLKYFVLRDYARY